MANRNDYTASSRALQTQADNTPQAVIRRHKDFLDARLKQIERWVRQGVSPEALVRFVMMDMATNEKLRECGPQSIFLGLLACAVCGLEPGALKGEAYLVPFAKQAVFVPGWRGIVKQARRSREVTGLTANVVREADTFDLDLGSDNRLVHKPALRGDRGDIVGAYAIATLVGGHREIEFMDRSELDKIRSIAEKRGKSPAWAEWPDQMARKSPIRRLGKRLPMGADYYVALALEQAHDSNRPQSEVLDIETDGAATKSTEQAERAPAFDVTDAEPVMSAEDEAAERAFAAEQKGKQS